MKKILMGLLSISSLIYAADVNISNPALDNTSVFDPELEQQGSITLKANITSEVTTVKYAVFVNTTDTLVGAKDVYRLEPFSLRAAAGTVSESAGFLTANENIYVKRVNDSAISPLTEQDRLEMKIFRQGADNYWTVIAENQIANGETNAWIQPLSLLSKTDLTKLGNETGLTVSNGYWVKNSTNEGIGVKGLGFALNEDGSITAVNGGNTTTNGSSAGTIADSETIKKWNTFFSQVKSFNTYIKVIVR